MKKIEIFDPAMCCPTGLCGTNIDPELMRIAVVIETLKKQGIIVTRHNLRDEPQVYVSNKTVNEYLQKHGADALPITLYNPKNENGKSGREEGKTKTESSPTRTQKKDSV